MAINIVHEIGGKWILPRLARALVDGIPDARACSWNDKRLLNAPDTEINYYVNDDCFVSKTSRYDVAFLDHPKHDYHKALRADHIVCMTPQYQRQVHARGRECDLVIQPVDTKVYCPKLILGFIGRFKGRIDYSERKGRDLLQKVQQLPFVELKYTLGDVPENEMPAFYRSLDYVIVTAEMEGGPMCLTEGLACGKRVIIPPTTGIAEMFPEGTLSYKAGDWESLRALLESLYEDKKRLADMVSKYTWAHWVEQHRAIFDRLRGRAEDVIPERAIVVIATPEIKDITDHTLPAIRAYADKCNAQLIVWDDVPAEYQHAKYRIMGLRGVKARRVLHLDADCFPLPDAPDIFEEHQPGYIYCWDETPIRKPGQVEGFRDMITAHTREAVEWPRAWWNPGVMLCDQEHLSLFRMPDWDVTAPDYLWYGSTVKNQPWINWLFARACAPVKELDRRWNMITALADSRTDGAYILHFGAEKVPDAHERKVAMTREYASKVKPRVLMATVVSGPVFERLYERIRPYHEDYARRHGYDYRVITQAKRDDLPSPSWWKLELASELDYYDCVVFVDGDAWPWKDAPSIVDVVPRGKFGSFNSLTLSYMNSRDAHAQVSYRKWCADMGLDVAKHNPISEGYYINGGVWVCWRDARAVLECPQNPRESAMYVEQHLLNWNLYEHPGLYHEIGREWNYGHLHVSGAVDAACKPGVWIAHMSGVPAGRREAVLTDCLRKRVGRVSVYVGDAGRTGADMLSYIKSKGYFVDVSNTKAGAVDLSDTVAMPLFQRNNTIKQRLESLA